MAEVVESLSRSEKFRSQIRRRVMIFMMSILADISMQTRIVRMEMMAMIRMRIMWRMMMMIMWMILMTRMMMMMSMTFMRMMRRQIMIYL